MLIVSVALFGGFAECGDFLFGFKFSVDGTLISQLRLPPSMENRTIFFILNVFHQAERQ